LLRVDLLWDGGSIIVEFDQFPINQLDPNNQQAKTQLENLKT